MSAIPAKPGPNGLYPIIRRVRRPLLPPEDPKAQPKVDAPKLETPKKENVAIQSTKTGSVQQP